MVSKSLKEVVLKPITGEWGTEGNNVQILRTTNFTNEGRVNYLKVVERNVDSNKIEKKKLKIGDIIIEKSGGSPKQPVGRVVFFEKEGVFLCNNFTAILRPKVDEVVPKYLLYILYCNHKFGFTSAYQNKTTGIINLQLPKYLEGTKIPLPPLDQQKKIAAILDAADAYRQKTKALITKYEELTQSLFLDMFGDPVRNPMGWELVKFDELVSDDCPLTYGIVQPGDEFENGIPCVRPVDLKMQYINLSTLKRIDPVISSKFKRTILKGGEILLSVRGSVGVISIAGESLKDSNVTRGIVPIWFDKDLANKLFFYYLYRTKPIQRRLSELSRGATLIQINLKDLRELKLIKPSLEFQNQFADSVQAIEVQKTQAQESLVQAEDLFNSLLQKAFKGELV